MALAALAFAASTFVLVWPDDALATHFAPCTNLAGKTGSFPPTATGIYHLGPDANGFEVDVLFRRGPAAVAPGPVSFIRFAKATIPVEHLTLFAGRTFKTIDYAAPGVLFDRTERSIPNPDGGFFALTTVRFCYVTPASPALPDSPPLASAAQHSPPRPGPDRPRLPTACHPCPLPTCRPAPGPARPLRPYPDLTSRTRPQRSIPLSDSPERTTPMSVFAKYRAKAYPYNFNVELLVTRIAGGTPTDPKVAEGWLKTKLTPDRDDLIREAVAEVMLERGIGADEATQVVSENKHLNGFRRDNNGLYLEGRCVKAAIKEAANVRWPKDRWGPSNKGTLSFFAEHVFVQEDRIPLGVTEASGVSQRFVHTWRGSGIQYEEYVDDAKLAFTVATDHKFTAEQWALMWLTGEQQGVGASRSQGYGRYEVTRWDPIA